MRVASSSLRPSVRLPAKSFCPPNQHFQPLSSLVLAAMGLLTIIRKSNHKERQLRVLFLGLDNSGKSTIVKRLLGAADWRDQSPTLGFDIHSLPFDLDRSEQQLSSEGSAPRQRQRQRHFTLNLWDIGGQRTLRPYWRNYFERTDGLVWVVDSHDFARLTECRDELWSLVVAEERLASASLLVLANKQDVPGAKGLEEVRRVLRLDELARQRGATVNVVACSAVNGSGYGEGMKWLVEDCERRLYWGSSSGGGDATTIVKDAIVDATTPAVAA